MKMITRSYRGILCVVWCMYENFNILYIAHVRGAYNMDENGDDRYCGKCFIGKINSYEVYIKEDVV